MQIVSGKRQNEQAIVELALTIPVLLLGIIVLLEFGRMVTTFAFVNIASREGAQYGAAVEPTENGILNYYDCDGIRDRTIQNTLLTDLNSNDVNISYETGASGSLKYATCEDLAAFRGYDSINFGDRIVVEVSKDMNLLLNYLGLEIDPVTISSASSQSISLRFKLASP